MNESKVRERENGDAATSGVERRYFDAKDEAFVRAVFAGADLETAERIASETAAKSTAKRGGARPGAGRKPTGRKNAVAVNFKVSAELKATFEEKARQAGLTGVEFFKRLVENA